MGISCLPRHDGATKAIKHWRGIRFENAVHSRLLIQENTLYVRQSQSILRNTIIAWVSWSEENECRDIVNERSLALQMSLSRKKGISIKLLWFDKNRYAGTGREYNVTSAIHAEGVPPRMESISVFHSAFNGINVTTPDAPVVINNCTVQYNKGKPLSRRSSFHLVGCLARGASAFCFDKSFIINMIHV